MDRRTMISVALMLAMTGLAEVDPPHRDEPKDDERDHDARMAAAEEKRQRRNAKRLAQQPRNPE